MSNWLPYSHKSCENAKVLAIFVRNSS